MSRYYTKQKFISLAKKKYGDKFTYGKTDYIGKRKDIIVTCKIHGDMTVNAGTFIYSNYRCKSCSLSEDRQRFIERSIEVHGNRYNYDKVDYINTITKVKIGCSKHGSFFILPYEHYAKRVGCMECHLDKNRMSQTEFIAKAKEVHGDKYDYSEVDYYHGDLHVTINCPDHGPFQQLGRAHVDGHGCNRCYITSRRSTGEEFIKQAKEVHGDKFDYSCVSYETNKTKVEIICPEHGPFKVTPNSHVSCRAGCPRCKESKGERRIRVFLEKHNIEFIQEYKIPENLFRYDFYLPDYKLLIEHQGHQHFAPIELFGGMSYYLETIKNDSAKAHLAKEEGYKLLTTKYWQMKRKGVEVNLEMTLRFHGHVFDETRTITSDNGPSRTVMSF